MSLDATVLIPAYNAAATLAEQLEALARQSYRGSWEVLVCDNGSTDETRAVALEFAARVPGLRVIDASDSRGPSHARNVGARAAQGAVLFFCDADDIATDTWLEAMVAGIADADAAAGGIEHTLLNTHYADRDEITPAFWRISALPQLPAASGQNLAVRAEVLAALGGFDEWLRFGEDADLCWRLQLAGYRIVSVPDALMHTRDRTSLRGAWRQAFNYGAADRQLTHRYARVRERYELAAAEAPPAGSQRSDGRPMVTRVASAATRMRRPRDLMYVTRRFGRRAGERWGKVDRTDAILEPPAVLPIADGVDR